MFHLFKKNKPSSRSLFPPLTLHVEKGLASKTDCRFSQSFRIGRDETCEVRLKDYDVSREHAEVYYENGYWWVRDLQSSNGTFVDGEKIDHTPILNESKIELGEDGPVLILSTENSPEQNPSDLLPDPTVDKYVEHYFTEANNRPAGEHTMFIRQAFQYVQQKQKWKYGKIIALFAALFLVAGGFAIYKHQQLQRQKDIALDIFYAMKALELDIAKLEAEVQQTSNTGALAAIREARARHRQMQENYRNFINELDVYRAGLSKEEKLILQVANIFGECELNMPSGFVQEVQNYIKKWQSTDRFENAMVRVKRNGYTFKIAEAMLNQDLPPQFFYLALQESNFDVNTCGPKTRYGIAKGAWQFIPKTARKYGLRVGPLYRYRRPDPRDERHDFDKSTRAAAEYLRFIYSTEAQASALLVMASYNWGEDRVRDLINRLPENPRDRNFWRLLEKYQDEIPRETYDYVFYIVSAAVIGENPKLFGFEFENPLAEVEKTYGG